MSGNQAQKCFLDKFFFCLYLSYVLISLDVTNSCCRPGGLSSRNSFLTVLEACLVRSRFWYI
jgi:hypothetical protein